jgi:hypothetical protein
MVYSMVVLVITSVATLLYMQHPLIISLPIPQGSEALDAPPNPLLNSVDVDMEGIDCTAILKEDEPAHIYYFNGQVDRVKSDLENTATSVHNITEALNLFMSNNYHLNSRDAHCSGGDPSVRRDNQNCPPCNSVLETHCHPNKHSAS